MDLVARSEPARLGSRSTLKNRFDKNRQVAVRVPFPADNAESETVRATFKNDPSISGRSAGNWDRNEGG